MKPPPLPPITLCKAKNLLKKIFSGSVKTAEKFLIYKQKDFKGQEVNRMFVIREPWLDFPLFGEDNPLLDWVKDTICY